MVTGRAFLQGDPGELFVMVAVILFGLVMEWLRDRHGEELATASELVGTMAIAEKAVIADAMKAVG